MSVTEAAAGRLKLEVRTAQAEGKVAKNCRCNILLQLQWIWW